MGVGVVDGGVGNWWMAGWWMAGWGCGWRVVGGGGGRWQAGVNEQSSTLCAGLCLGQTSHPEPWFY